MLIALEQYYKEKCDGIWEHTYGFTIETCDNPGWQMKINEPNLFKILDLLKRRGEIPSSVKVRIGCAELSEVILFSENLQPLSIFIKQLIDYYKSLP